jgi:hypothetical protein
MLDIPSISAIVAAIGVLIGVVFTVLQLRDLVKTRQTDLVMRLYSAFGSSEHMEAYRGIMAMETEDFDKLPEKYGPIRSTMVSEVCAFYEGIGVLLSRKLIDIGLVDDLFSTPIIQIWQKVEHSVRESRKRWKRPQIWEYFEYLYNEMKKREQQLQQAGVKNG